MRHWIDQASALTPEFFHTFGTWFNVDTIDLGDPEAVRSSAGACASDLARQVTDVESLKAELRRASTQLDGPVIDRFERATDTDWRFDAETEQTLRIIIDQLVQELEFQQRRALGR